MARASFEGCRFAVWARVGALAFALTCFTGCVGSILTRGQGGGDIVGKYPFLAVIQDVQWIGERSSFHSIAGPHFVLFLPFDLACDALLLPFDLLAWLLGFSRMPPEATSPPAPPPHAIKQEAEFAAAKKVKEHAMFKGWSEHKTGSWVKFLTVVAQPGLKIEVDLTLTLREITKDRGVVEHKTQFRASGGGSWEENRREIILKERDSAPIKIEKEGDEEVKVAGRKFQCHWIQGTRGEDMRTKIKIWFSEDIPGGIAKSEVSGGGQDPNIKTEAVAW